MIVNDKDSLSILDVLLRVGLYKFAIWFLELFSSTCQHGENYVNVYKGCTIHCHMFHDEMWLLLFNSYCTYVKFVNVHFAHGIDEMWFFNSHCAYVKFMDLHFAHMALIFEYVLFTCQFIFKYFLIICMPFIFGF